MKGDGEVAQQEQPDLRVKNLGGTEQRRGICSNRKGEASAHF